METKELEKEFLTMIEAQKRTIYKVCYCGRVSPAIGEIAHSTHGYTASR